MDGAVELVGVNVMKDTLRAVRAGGTVCFTGMLSDQWTIPEFYPMDCLPNGVRLTAYSGESHDLPADALKDFLDAVADGRASIPIGRVYTLDEIVDAHREMEARRLDGKGSWSCHLHAEDRARPPSGTRATTRIDCGDASAPEPSTIEILREVDTALDTEKASKEYCDHRDQRQHRRARREGRRFPGRGKHPASTSRPRSARAPPPGGSAVRCIRGRRPPAEHVCAAVRTVGPISSPHWSGRSLWRILMAPARRWRIPSTGPHR